MAENIETTFEKQENLPIFKVGTVYTDKVPGIFDMKYTGPSVGGVCACDCSCFLEGSLVLMADGSYKNIENIEPGDWVMGAFGTKNQVLALERPLLGSRLLFKINGEHSTTAEHPHISIDGKIYVGNLAALTREYGEENSHHVITANGIIEEWVLPGVDLNKVNQLEIGTKLLTVDGMKEIISIEPYILPPETQLYSFVLSGSHTYFVEGYAVTGWARDDDFDYDTWESTGKKLTIEDYRIKIKV